MTRLFEAREIELTRGYKALVDAEDYGWVSEQKWIATTNGKKVRAGRWTRDNSGKRKFLFLYREILAKYGRLDPAKPEVDHINGDSLDDRKANLRSCSRTENLRNRRGSRLSKTGIKGVSWNKANNNWNAQIGINGRKVHLGCFGTKEAAAEAYNRAAKKHFGQFAQTSGDSRGGLELSGPG